MSPIDTDEPTRASGPGRVLSGRAATVVGVLLGLALAAVFATVMVVGRSDAVEPGPDQDHDHDHEHVEVDPLTDQPVVDPCESSPEMCGDGAGAPAGPCDDAAMCGPVIPGGAEEEIDAGSGSCVGELCGDIGPGEADDASP